MVLRVTLDSVRRKTKTKGEISYVEKSNNKIYPCPDIPDSSNTPKLFNRFVSLNQNPNNIVMIILPLIYRTCRF